MRRSVLIGILLLLGACAPHPPVARQFDVFFQVNSSKLTPEGQQIVDAIATAARDGHPSSVVVEGQASGATPRDAQLADQRATVVSAALKAAGVDPSKINQHAALVIPAVTDSATQVATHKVTVQLMP